MIPEGLDTGELNSTSISLLMFQVPCNTERAYCHQPGTNPDSVTDTEKLLMIKPNNNLPDQKIEPFFSAVALRTTRPRFFKILSHEMIVQGVDACK